MLRRGTRPLGCVPLVVFMASDKAGGEEGENDEARRHRTADRFGL